MVVAGGGGGSTGSTVVEIPEVVAVEVLGEGKFSPDPYTASPLAQTPCSGVRNFYTSFPITVGGGGPGGPQSGPYIGS